MKRRVTYTFDGGSHFDPDQARVTHDALSIRALKAAKEDRVTFNFNELPAEIWHTLKRCYKLHIRWVTESPYQAIAPFASRLSPGLHVFFTPLLANRPTEPLCSTLKYVFSQDIKCVIPEISFAALPILSDRVASTPFLHLHTLLPSLTGLVIYLQKVCLGDPGCQSHASSILSADSLDIDYDSISHSLTFSAYWSKSSQSEGWTENFQNHEFGTSRVEVGLLALEQATSPEELSVGGFLTVIGEDDKLRPALFSFPSQHHPLPLDSVYNVSFDSPLGLHPTLKISLPRSALSRPPAPSDATCALHTYVTLPSSIFADKHQLSTRDPVFLSSHNLVSLRSISGATDLEAPDWVVPQWGSSVLLELATANDTISHSGNWDINIPLHLRYLLPSESGYRTIAVPWPVVFWACIAQGGTEMGINPFNRENLGWDGIFSSRTMFFQLHPSPTTSLGDSSLSLSRLVEELRVPVLQSNNTSRLIEIGTIAVILIGFVWTLWRLSRVVCWSRMMDWLTEDGGEQSLTKAKEKDS